MVPDISQITGLGDYSQKTEKSRTLYQKGDKTFLVINSNTIEIRCDQGLSKNLQSKFESVMQSRYFGQGGIEIVLAGQLDQSELEDLIRLSYSITNN